jgi:hypothetical protein
MHQHTPAFVGIREHTYAAASGRARRADAPAAFSSVYTFVPEKQVNYLLQLRQNLEKVAEMDVFLLYLYFFTSKARK